MSVEEVAAEVCSVFKEPIDNRNDFPFSYLQPTGSGSPFPQFLPSLGLLSKWPKLHWYHLDIDK